VKKQICQSPPLTLAHFIRCACCGIMHLEGFAILATDGRWYCADVWMGHRKAPEAVAPPVDVRKASGLAAAPESPVRNFRTEVA